MKSGSLNLLEPPGPHRACYGTAPLYIKIYVKIYIKIYVKSYIKMYIKIYIKI